MIPVTKQISPFLTLKTVSTDKFKTERISITVEDIPDARRTPIERFVFSVLKRGCVSYPTQQKLNLRLDELYSASVSPFFLPGGARHKMGFCADMLADAYTGENIFEKTVELLFDMFWNPVTENGSFLEKYVESERENICDSIRSVVNNPRLYAVRRFLEVMYAGDDYSLSSNGTVELVNSITADELTSVYNELIKNSSYEVFYVGAKSADEVEATVIKYFEKYGYGKVKNARKAVDFAINTKKVKRVTEEMKLSQGKLVMGFKCGINITCGDDFYAMLMLNEIFGASPVSKLFMNVREKLGLCYYCSSRYDVHKGFLYVSSGIEKSDRAKTEKEILKQLSNIQKGKITDAEFTAAKRSLLNVYSETTDSAVAIERFYMLRDEYSVLDTIDVAKQKINAITLDDVLRIAKNIILDTVYFLQGRDGEEGDSDD